MWLPIKLVLPEAIQRLLVLSSIPRSYIERQLSHCYGSYGTMQSDNVTQFQPLDGKSGGDGDGIKMGTGGETSTAPAKLGSQGLRTITAAEWQCWRHPHFPSCGCSHSTHLQKCPRLLSEPNLLAVIAALSTASMALSTKQPHKNPSSTRPFPVQAASVPLLCIPTAQLQLCFIFPSPSKAVPEQRKEGTFPWGRSRAGQSGWLQ